MNLCRYLPNGVVVPTHDGRKFSVDLSTGMQSTLFFLGEYEKAISDIVEGILKQASKQAVFIDIGANFGWYTSLFHKYAGESGAVHSFEPVPSIFENLERNYELMGSPPNVHLNNLALGEEEAELTINLFAGLSTGHASLSTQDRDDAIPFKCRVITLDSYLEANKVGDVDFVKVDIEGAELSFLKGAERLFKQENPPIWLMEMALNQTRNFGYLPNDLIEFIAARADYDFFKIDEINAKLVKITGFAADDIGANVICIPKSAGLSLP
ncbi:MAG TPA: FkbM family methyltransferase [Pyrinomonadaceae bacterium]|nr:FkbM family methyltransferase [Pyrinomonadaceae bacterium]